MPDGPKTTTTTTAPSTKTTTATTTGGTSAAAAAAGGGNKSNNKVNFSSVTESIPPDNTNAAAADAAAAAATPTTKKPKLYKSSRMKGYVTLVLASVINYNSSLISQRAINSSAVASTSGQQMYARAAALVSCLVTSVIVLAHIDRWSPLSRLWLQIFGDKMNSNNDDNDDNQQPQHPKPSVFELLIIFVLVIWWTVATAVETSVRGIAGDGKGQYNLYFSTWGCCWLSYWTLERWLVAFGWAPFKVFISSWPFRAPGWIAICTFSFFTLMTYLDLSMNHEEAAKGNPAMKKHYEQIGDGQWLWLLFVGAFTLVPSVVFIVIELFRETSVTDQQQAAATNNNNNNHHTTAQADSPAARQRRISNFATGAPHHRSSRQLVPQRLDPLPDKGESAGGKGPLENILEGFCLVLLVCAWIPTVIISTTPGGAASLVGNAYFFTWTNTVFVMETFIWFVHDLRKGVHSALVVKEREYRKRQYDVLQKSRALETKRRALQRANLDEPQDDISLDDILMIPAANANAYVNNSSNNSNDNLVGLESQQPPQQAPSSQLQQHPVFDLSSQEDDHNDNNNHRTMTINSRDLASSSNDVTQQLNNVRRHRRHDDEDDNGGGHQRPRSPLSQNESTLEGSTVFFEAWEGDDNGLDNSDIHDPLR